MRKSILDSRQGQSELREGWLDLNEAARVEITSEDPAHPIEAALVGNSSGGWRADDAGPQKLRILFDEPRRIRRIYLHFVETDLARAQEFAIRWSPDGETFREAVRQQWNFSPGGSPEETEDYEVDLHPVMVLELSIDPDRSGGGGRASLERLRLA